MTTNFYFVYTLNIIQMLWIYLEFHISIQILKLRLFLENEQNIS